VGSDLKDLPTLHELCRITKVRNNAVAHAGQPRWSAAGGAVEGSISISWVLFEDLCQPFGDSEICNNDQISFLPIRVRFNIKHRSLIISV
jgi:hypothetical protein